MNRRHLITSVATAGIAIAGGATWYLIREDAPPRGASDRIDLLAGMYADAPHRTDPALFAMLSLTGGMADSMQIELRCLDLDAAPVPPHDGIDVSLTNLVTGETATDLVVEVSDDHWTLTQSSLTTNGWWQVVARFAELTASWTFLVPDPNLTGFATPPTMEADPQATAMLNAALDTLTKRTSLRWWEWLSGGDGTIILARFAVTTPASNGQPASFESDAILAGRIPLDATAAAFRGERIRSVTIGDQALRVTDGGTPEVINPIGYLPISEYNSTYAAFEGAHFGITATIDDRDCQLIAFHLPGVTEAWFAFWIDVETLFLRELFMLSVNHYMHWVYSDIDADFVIDMPR